MKQVLALITATVMLMSVLTFTAVAEDDVFKTVTLSYTGVNATRADNTCIIYRDKATSGTNTWGYEVVVDKDGFVTSVGGNNNAIPEGGYVISAIGKYKQPLIDAAAVGMTAALDETAKTVTIGLTKEGAVKKAAILLQNCISSYDKAKSDYLLIDYDVADAAIDSIIKLKDEIASCISKDDISGYKKASDSFDDAITAFDNLLIENPAVEGRCIWLRPAVWSENEIKKIAADIYARGFNSVCIELMYDNTMICPMPEDSLFETNPKCGKKDILQMWIDAFHAYDIEVIGWMSSLRVSHSSSSYQSQAVANKKPEWRIKANNGTDYLLQSGIKHYYLNPAIPEACDFLTETYRYIVKNYALDGFQLDYIRYPDGYADGIYYGYDETTLKLFKEQTGLDASTAAKGSDIFNKFAQFKADLVTAFAKQVTDMIHAERPDMYVSAAVAPQYEEGVTKKHQDVYAWLATGLLDAIYPMSYGTTDAFIKWTGITVDLARDCVSYMGMRDGGYEQVKEQIIASRQYGADGSAMFAYAQLIAGDYTALSSTVYCTKAVSPTYDGRAAVIAQIEELIKRYDTVMNCDLANQAVQSLLSIKRALDGGGTLKQKSGEIKQASDEYLQAMQGSDYYAAAEKDASKLLRILLINRDEAKTEYSHGASQKETSADESDGDAEPKSSDVSDEIRDSESQSVTSEATSDASDETSTPKSPFEGSTPTEKVFQYILFGVVIFAAVCAPIYIVLDIKKHKKNKHDDSDK